MAPSNTPGRKKRENQFFDPGVQGRKTGLTLKDTGIRDEHGLEPTDGIFSSPEKQSAKPTARKSNGTSTSSEDMDVDESSAPDINEVLTSRRKGLLPLPVGRSPIKTKLGATPRRGSSVGAQSPFRSQTSNRASSHPAVNRRLDFSITETETSVTEMTQANGNGFDETDIEMNGVLSDEAGGIEEDSEVQVNGTYADSPGAPVMDDPPIDDTMPGSEVPEIEVTEVIEAQPKRRGRKRKSDNITTADSSELVNGDTSTLVDEEIKTVPAAIKRRGRPPRVQPPPAAATTTAEPAKEERPIKRTRGRISDVEPMEEIPELEEVEAKPESEPDKDHVADAPKTRGRKKKAPSERDPNAKVVSAKATRKGSALATKPSKFAQPGMSRGLQRIRSQTPAQDDGAAHTRSGRLSYKPLEFWKGEKVVFTAGQRPGMSNIQQIFRTDDVTPIKRSTYRPSRRHRSKPSHTTSIFGGVEQDEEEEESWELEEGIVSGSVRVWDSELGAVPTDEEKEQQLAFASSKIEPRPTPDNPNFCFTKTLTMPFFGAGVIELPPKGYKGTKNSRRFQFLFFVHYGKVTVEVAGNRFVITKGGMWQVPRGNFYSITNETDRPAKIVFAQGCEADAQPLQPSHSQQLPGPVDDTSIVTPADA